MDLKKKIGPLPVWAWGLILGAVGYYVYSRRAASATTSSSATDSVLDPNAVDPNTGLTYGQEEDAALNANAAGGSSLNGGGTTSDSGAQGTVPPNEFGDFLTFLDEFNQFQQGLAGGANSGISAGSLPPATLPANTPGLPPIPVQNTSPPTSTASTHTAPVQVQSTQDTTVLGQINSLLTQGFKKLPGTTQAGGLSQTGTYVYTPPKGASLHTGPTKYFVYGTSATGLHIRPAT